LHCRRSAFRLPNTSFSPELTNIIPNGTVDVIVVYRQAPTTVHHNRVAALGGELKRTLDFIRAAHYSIPPSQLELLSNDPDVEFVAPDRPVFSTANAMYTGNPDYGWRTTGADIATNVFGVDGTGVGIAMIDSGIDALPDLGQRVIFKTSLIGPATTDTYGHGDQVRPWLQHRNRSSHRSHLYQRIRYFHHRCGIFEYSRRPREQ